MTTNPFPVLITKEEMLFNRIQIKPNGLPIRVELDELITPRGLVIPLGYSGMCGLDMLERGDKQRGLDNITNPRFLILDAESRLYENNAIYDDETKKVLCSIKRVVYSDVYVRGETHDSEVLGMVSWLIAKGDLKKVAQLLPTIDRSLHCDFEIVPLSGIRSLIRTAAREESNVV